MISELFSGNAFLCSCIWQSTVCITAGLIVSFALKRWPARAHRVLFLAIIAAVLVPLLSASVRHYELGIFVAEPPAVQPEVKERAMPNEYETTAAVPVEYFEPGLGTTGEYSAPTVAIPSESIEIPWRQIALWAWISVSLILAGRLLVTFVMGFRLLSRAKSLDNNKIHEAACAAKTRLGVDEVVGAYSSDKVRSPVIWCWGKRPVLLLPSDVCQSDDRLDWVSVLCHELAHWKRRDHISGLLAELAVCVLPWNPLLWWAKRRLVKLSEQACDDWVLASGQQGTDYAESLLDLQPQRQIAFAPAVVSSKNGLATRVRRILQDKCGNPRTGMRWALLVSVVAVVVITAIAFAQSRPGKPDVAACKVAPVVPTVRLDTLPAGWRLEYDDGIVPGVGKRWRDGMAKNLAELRAVPTPANEYDESWKEERLEIEILSIPGEQVGTIIIWGERGTDRIILAPDKYLLSYKREREDPNSGCHIPLNRVKFPVGLSRPGMYELKFSPKLETPESTSFGKFSVARCMGKVVDSNGNLLGGAKVAAYEMLGDMAGNVNLRLVAEAITKSDGNFLFETKLPLKRGRSIRTYVVGMRESLALGWTEWPLYGTQQVTITLGTPMKLVGMVVDENSAPVPKAEIRAVLFKKRRSEEEKIKWLPGIGPLEWLAAMSDNNGRFQFNDIPTNVRADLLITASGLSTIYTRKPDEIRSYEGAAFAAGETDIKITMPPEARIEGKVVDNETGMGIAGATFAVVPHFTGVFFERFLCTSKEDGTFSIGGLRNGEYLIRADPLQGQGPRLNVTVESGKTTRDVIIKWPHVGQSRPASTLTTDPEPN